MAFSLTSIPSATSALATLSVLVAALYLLYRLALPKPIPGIPYNKAAVNSLLGDMPAMLKAKDETGEIFVWMGQQLVELDSPIIQLFVRPFSKPWVITADFREAQDICLRRAQDFDRSKFFRDVFSTVLPEHHMTMLTTAKHKAQRRMLSDTMTPSFLNDVAAPQVYTAVQDLMQLWKLKTKLASNHPWSAPHDVTNMAVDAIWAAAFGSEMGMTKSQVNLLQDLDSVDLPGSKDTPVEFPVASEPAGYKAIVTLTESLGVAVNGLLPRLQHWLYSLLPHMRSAYAHKEKIVQEHLEEAWQRFSIDGEDGDKEVRSAIDHLVSREVATARKESREPQHNSRVAKDELLGFLIGGSDTTSTTITWGLKNLTDHPRVQSKLREALSMTFNAAKTECRDPTAHEIAKAHIPYLDAMVEEMLRCSGTASIISRAALHDTEVLGHVIPKGTDFVMLNVGPGYSSKPVTVNEKDRSKSSREAKDRTGEWDLNDIGDFRPERWLVPNEKSEVDFDPKAGPNFPFGSGVRGCFGKRLAYLQLRIVFVLLLWKFEMLATPTELNGYAATFLLTRTTQQCYLRLKQL